MIWLIFQQSPNISIEPIKPLMTPLKSTIVPRPWWVIFNLSILLLHYGANVFIETQEKSLYFNLQENTS